jgi:hypothetical protein
MKGKIAIMLNIILPIMYGIALVLLKYNVLPNRLQYFIWDYRDLLWTFQVITLIGGFVLCRTKKYRILFLLVFMAFVFFGAITIHFFNEGFV